MANVEFSVDASDAIKFFDKIKGNIVSEVKAALYQEALEIMAASKELVPVDTGVLRSSGHVEKPQDDGRGVTVTLGYGGAAQEYALIVHEDLTARHKDGQTAKYLERPMLERQPNVVKNVVAKINRMAK